MAKRTVPKKKRGICVIKDMAAGMTKKEARKDCGVTPMSAYPTKKHTGRKGRRGKAPKGSCSKRVMKITGRSEATADRVCKAIH